MFLSLKADHPDPGKPYLGTEKCWYVPATNEGNVLIDLFKKALSAGLLFHLDLNRKYNKYQVFISKNVLLKTEPFEGGR